MGSMYYEYDHFHPLSMLRRHHDLVPRACHIDSKPQSSLGSRAEGVSIWPCKGVALGEGANI